MQKFQNFCFVQVFFNVYQSPFRIPILGFRSILLISTLNISLGTYFYTETLKLAHQKNNKTIILEIGQIKQRKPQQYSMTHAEIPLYELLFHLNSLQCLPKSFSGSDFPFLLHFAHFHP